MERLEVSVEVGPIDPDTVERLKADGHVVYRGNRSWRVVATEPVFGRDSVRAQAHVLVMGLIKDYGLTALSSPPAFGLRDPDGDVDTAATNLILEDARRAYDPDPLPRPKRKWYQKQMELGLGERKGD